MEQTMCFHFNSRLLSGWLLCALVSVPAALAAPAEPMLLTSASKQFIVRGLPQSSVFAGTRENVVYVDPPLLVVICERIKDALHEELGWKGRWRSTIFIDVHPVRFDNEPIQITGIRSRDGWRYRMDMPDETDRRRALQSIVQVLLLEFANRSAGERSGEMPPWLVEGMTEYLMQGSLAGLVFQPNVLFVRQRNHNSSARLREQVRTAGALNVDQLNWPEFKESDAAALARYRTSAHLFVRELLRLRGGPDCLSAMMALLPEYLNWQSAFLLGFEPHFQRMLDVEKWWSLVLVQTRTHEESVLWAPAESRAKLEEILLTPVQVRITKAELPRVSRVPLPTLITSWEFEQQEPVLRAKIAQLQGIRIRLQHDHGRLADDYRETLEEYLEAHATASRSRLRQLAGADAESTVEEALRRLKQLEERRAELFVQPAAAVGEVPLTHPRPNL